MLKQHIKNDAYFGCHADIQVIIENLNFDQNSKLLDIGCAEGDGTLKYAKSGKFPKDNIYGVDTRNDLLNLAREKFNVAQADLEKDSLPFGDNFFDLIVINQVLEHLKNIDHLMKEISRTLKPSGYLIASTPNLAALHNRLLLLFGKQPLCVNIFSEHIRGYTKEALESLALKEIVGSKKVLFKGSGFYPFYGWIAKIFSRIFPSFSVYIILVFQK